MSSAFYKNVANRILSSHGQDLPDLRGTTVLLPNYHVARPLAKALMRAAQVPALLLPRMVTLDEWATQIPLETPAMTDSQRHALLYQHLRKQQWFEQSDLWAMTRELLALFDELTCSLDELPGNADAFAAGVQQAYQSRQNSALQLEARLVFELWHAMQSGDAPDKAGAYQQRLAKLAMQADKPLYVLRTSDWDALEQHFLDAYAQRAEVTVFDLREMAATSLQSPAPLAGKLHFFAAVSLEQEARAAAMQVRLWLQEGKRDIAIVAQDRVAARRMRALLERSEVLVQDETGWTYSTLSVSTVLDRWLTALQSDFYHHDLLDLLKSPFIFADMTAGERKAAVYHLEKLLREQGVVTGLEKFIALVEHEISLHQPLARLRQAAALLEQGKRLTLSEWLIALNGSLRVLGIDKGLQQDDAGARLMAVLAAWQQELAGDTGRYRFAEWQRWLAQQLDNETYRDTGIESPVRLTHFAATRWREFDAVLLLGCDAEHLPSIPDGGRWFNDAVRGSLDLPTRATHAARQRDDLLSLLALNECVLVIWQKDRNGEEVLLSPYLQMLRDRHQMEHGDDLGDVELAGFLAAEDARTVELPRAEQPIPSLPSGAVPQSVSSSAYNSLVTCPYQFYASYVLHLKELDEVQEAIEKRDYGIRIHEILQRFHARYPCVSEHAVAEMESALKSISEEVFADLLRQDFAARAWLARWYRSLPAYLEWQSRNEADGWRYAGAESGFDLPLEGVRLRGRIDRQDVREQEKRVCDYKTQNDQSLRNKLREAGEDVQLACYAWATDAEHAAFVSIDNGKVKSVAPTHDVAQLARLNAERLESLMARIRGGAGMPANGIDAACEYCEVRGVCRKGEWQ